MGKLEQLEMQVYSVRSSGFQWFELSFHATFTSRIDWGTQMLENFIRCTCKSKKNTWPANRLKLSEINLLWEV